MPFTLTPETGAGVTGANSYASLVQGNDYFAAKLHTSVWDAATDPNKEKALAMATATIDAAMTFSGYRFVEDQALEWPRQCAVRPRAPQGGYAYGVGPSSDSSSYWDTDEIPPRLVSAVCELAQCLLAKNLTADREGKGIKRVGLGQGAVDVEFDKTDKTYVLPDEVLRLLSGLGSAGNSGQLKTGRA